MADKRTVVSERLKQIIEQANGNRTNAETLLRAAIDANASFLRALVDPFLPGIIAHVLNGMAGKSAAKQAVNPPSLKSTEMERLVQGLSNNIADAAVRVASPSRQADTMRALAKAHADKRKR